MCIDTALGRQAHAKGFHVSLTRILHEGALPCNLAGVAVLAEHSKTRLPISVAHSVLGSIHIATDSYLAAASPLLQKAFAKFLHNMFSETFAALLWLTVPTRIVRAKSWDRPHRRPVTVSCLSRQASLFHSNHPQPFTHHTRAHQNNAIQPPEAQHTSTRDVLNFFVVVFVLLFVHIFLIILLIVTVCRTLVTSIRFLSISRCRQCLPCGRQWC